MGRDFSFEVTESPLDEDDQMLNHQTLPFSISRSNNEINSETNLVFSDIVGIVQGLITRSTEDLSMTDYHKRDVIVEAILVYSYMLKHVHSGGYVHISYE